MKRRGHITLIVVLLAASVLLLAWLKRPASRDDALTAHALNTVQQPAPVSENEPSPEDSAAPDNTDSSVPTEAPDIVSAGSGARPRRTPIENVSGPEVGPGLTPGAVLQNMRSVIRDYGARFGGNPVGNNREITAKLNGGNSKQVVFLKPEDGMRINDRGQLVDNWGTPFFFHQISGTEMEIHSAGPDGKMWTPDDLVIK